MPVGKMGESDEMCHDMGLWQIKLEALGVAHPFFSETICESAHGTAG